MKPLRILAAVSLPGLVGGAAHGADPEPAPATPSEDASADAPRPPPPDAPRPPPPRPDRPRTAAPAPPGPPRLAANAAARGVVVGFTGAQMIPLIPFLGYTYFSAANRWAPAVGFAWQKPVQDSGWNFAPEVWYSQFGTRFGAFSLVFDTISVPLMFRKHGRTGPVTPFFEVGPEFGFALGIRNVSTLFPYSYIYANAYGAWAILSRLQVGARIGAGLSFPLKNTRGFVSLRSFQGVMPKPGVDGFSRDMQTGVVGGVFFGRPKQK